ncbi:MAG: 2-C-methyl-D-erythritol 4-phosphate cytidylyltransferase [Candidatus Caenarcaniphilales bacterium]|nr:2-C-methyl-D-erythritol 4-phosphate cytidylyltransferase [Candidatus Caenarcaniphilales bacterium]
MKEFNKKLFTALLLAGGEGSRFSSKLPKQFCELKKDFLVIEKSLQTISEFATVTVIALFTQQLKDQELKSKLKKIGEKTESEILFVQGGENRQESVWNCLKEVDTEYLFIHDAARPLVHREDVKRLLEQTLISQAAILAKPVTDTIKQIKEKTNNQIEKTIERKLLWTAETPQAFKTEIYTKACEHAKKTNFVGTDDASLLEHFGLAIELVESKHPNLKITHPIDIEIAKMILGKGK